jgi:hypothetical protein
VETFMRPALLVPALVVLALAPVPAAAVKKAAYPEIKVEMPAPFKGDAALDAVRKAFADAVAKKSLAALEVLVAPNFQWTAGGDRAEDFDEKRDGVHNFKVAFGFRPFGKNADGPTEIGPQWEVLAYFADIKSLAQEPSSPLVCGPAAAVVSDEKTLEQAIQKVEEENEPAEWVYVLDEVTLSASPTGGGAVGKAARMLMPVVSVHPPSHGSTNADPPTPTHAELLLPSGKTGWVPVQALNPLFVDRLCYVKSDGGWKIAAFDQAE